MKTLYDQQLNAKIPYLKKYPNYLPHISYGYANSNLKVLIIGELENKYRTRETVMHIYNLDLAKLKVPKIARNKQIEIGLKLELMSESIDNLKSKISSTKSLQKSLINQVF